MANERGNRIPANYNSYRLTPAQVALSAIATGLAGMAALYVFYMNISIALLGLLLGIAGPRLYRRRLIERRKSDLNLQFRDFLYALNSSVGAGGSLDESIIAARDSLRALYMSDDGVMLRELNSMEVRLRMHASATDLLADLARRSGNEDIQSFATVLAKGAAMGIDQVELIQKTVRVITEKLEIKQEIGTKIAAVRLEQRVMLVMPVALMLLINLMAPDYMRTLYESPFGYLIVTIAVAMILGAAIVANKIMNIRV